jgi:hypothetical protein
VKLSKPMSRYWVCLLSVTETHYVAFVCQLLSSRLLYKNLKIRTYKTIILPVVLYGCETWSLTLREEHRLRLFENRVLRRIFGRKRDKVIGGWRKLQIMRSFITCTLRQVKL